MNAILPGLVVDIEARIDKLEKGLARANAAQRRAADQMEGRAKQSADRLRATYGKAGEGIAASLGKLAVPFAGGLIGGAATAAITETISKVGEVARGVAEIGDQARRAGVSAKVFQEWAFVAEQNRIGIDQMTDGLKELNLRADEFVITGKGAAAEAFGRLGYSAEELKTKLKDPSALLVEIIGRLGQLDRAAQIRIADEIFGGSAGERFVELINQGEAGIQATIDRANDLGIVMDDELIAKADALNRRFNEIANTVGVALKSAIVSAADSLADFLDGFRAYENQRNSSLETRMNALVVERVQLLNEIDALKDESQLSANALSLGFGNDSAITQRQIAEKQAQIDALDAEEAQIAGILHQRMVEKWAPKGGTWTPPATPPTGGTGSTKTGGGGGSSRSADDFARAVEAINKETASLQAEALAMVATAAASGDYGTALAVATKEAELLAAAQRAGKEITPALRAEIAALARGYGEAAKATKRAEEAQEQLKRAQDDMRSTFEGAFTGLISGAHTFHDALGMILERLTEMAASKIFDQIWGGAIGDGITGFLSSILGFSGGGYTGSGGKYEPAGIVHRGEFVLSKTAVDRLGVGNLQALHSAALRGYADGGYVGPSRTGILPYGDSARAERALSVTLNSPITINGSAGSPEQNQDLADRMAREMRNTIRAEVVLELRQQMRPGNMIGNLRR